MSTGALDGIRVIELGHIIGGPFCGHLFADHGAEVIKVEPPGKGDPMRGWGGLYKGVGLYWSIIARNKKSVTMDMRQQAGQAAFRELIATADVVIENFRPGTMERWGLGYQDLRKINPGIVMVQVSGFGQTGPYKDRAGFGSVAEAMSGFRHLSGEPGRAPVRVGISIGDALAGTQGFIGAVLALFARDRPNGSGVGQLVDVALYEAMWMYMESLAAEYEKLGRIREPSGALLKGIAPSSVYPTIDGEWIIIGANQDTVFRRLADAMGRDDWLGDDSPYATHELRGAAQLELDEIIGRWTATFSSTDVLTVLEKAGVPSGRIYTARDIVGDPHYRDRGMVVQVPEPGLDGETVPQPGIVPKMSGTPGVLERGGPLLGEHNDELLAPLLGEVTYQELREAGVI